MVIWVFRCEVISWLKLYWDNNFPCKKKGKYVLLIFVTVTVSESISHLKCEIFRVFFFFLKNVNVFKKWSYVVGRSVYGHCECPSHTFCGNVAVYSFHLTSHVVRQNKPSKFLVFRKNQYKSRFWYEIRTTSTRCWSPLLFPWSSGCNKLSLDDLNSKKVLTLPAKEFSI